MKLTEADKKKVTKPKKKGWHKRKKIIPYIVDICDFEIVYGSEVDHDGHPSERDF